MGTRSRRTPEWFRTVALAAALVWAVVSLYYWTGAAGIRAFGATTSFGRERDISLFMVDDARAFRVDKYGVMLVRYKRGTIPFCPLCGVNQLDGIVIPDARYRKGDWIYTNAPAPSKDAVNLKTGEVVDLPEGGGAFEAFERPPPEFVARGLDFDEANAIDRGVVRASYPRLSTINESCVTFNAAFIIVFGVLIVFGVVLALRPRSA